MACLCGAEPVSAGRNRRTEREMLHSPTSCEGALGELVSHSSRRTTCVSLSGERIGVLVMPMSCSVGAIRVLHNGLIQKSDHLEISGSVAQSKS